MPIRVLSEQLASRIAAGEVIERPASVVKELVENALDAGASRITIEVEGGGLTSIVVSDNGTGIGPSEIELAFQRFATSKLDETSDLSGIRTLGFRGEALPSIASVSHVEATSRSASSDMGVRLQMDNGSVVSRENIAAPSGTTVRVTRLFKNVPARLKFMTSVGGESSRTHQLAAAYALARPDVAFRLTLDGEERISSPGNGECVAAVVAVYGAKTAASMLPVDADPVAAFAVEGLISSPALSRGNRNYITLSVNGRLVQSRRLTFAVEQAYRGFLAERRFPVAVLNIRAPFDDVDVNVHPAKAEVRFLREDIIFAELQRAIRAALSERSPVQSFTAQASRRSLDIAGESPAPADFRPNPADGAVPGPVIRPDVEVTALSPPARAVSAGPVTHKQALPILRVIGQAHETYILAEGPGGLFLIDQHAAHERVLYEEISARTASNATESQRLLEPQVVEAGPEHASTIESRSADLAAAGFDIEPFGPKSVLLRAVPKLLTAPGRAGSPGDWLLKLLDEVAEQRNAGSWQDRLLHTMACHAAVRAGQKLTTDEARTLIARLETTQQPHTCPHGRPTMIHLAQGHLERQFGRK